MIIRESAVNGTTDSNGNEVVSENTPDENNDTDDPSSNDNNGDGNNIDDNTETDMDMETDTDNDGIPDYYEDLIGTDKTEPDTDGDNLSDYEELAKTGSDPTVYDSVTEGISDADADSDGDGIANKEELELGLNPASKDSDLDGIKDGEEAAYGTDPLNEDTDGDTIKDGDELVLGFDPLNIVTGGIADNEHRTEQHLDENSEVLAVFNRKNEEYKLSVDIKAAGLVSSELKLIESPYSGTIHNDAIVGLVPHIEYGKSDTIDSITVRFRLDELLNNGSGSGSTSDNMSELWDLCDKYGIFCYFEEESLFLPVETLYDEDTNSFYTTTDRAGTYCLMDMAKFLQEQEYFRIQEDPAYINVQFILQCSGADKDAFLEEQELIIDVFTKMIDQYGEGNIRVSVVKFYSSLEPWYVYNGGDDIWFSEPSELKAQLDTVPYSRTAQAEGGKMFRGVYYSLENTIKPNFIFLLQNGAIHCNGWEYTQVELCRAGVYYSEVLLEKYVYSDEEYKNDVEEAIESVGGLQTILGADTADKLFGYVCANTTDAQSKTVYQTITANGWEIVNLASPLRSGSLTDTDGDGITDWKEVDTDKIERSLDGEVILPTIKECMQMVDKPYVEAGMKKFEKYMDKLPIDSVKMLPIKSSPTRVDTDGDNIPDGFVVGMTGCYQFSDPNPLKSDVTITELEGGYISIDYEKPAAARTDWGASLNGGRKASYGGCQMWCGEIYGDDFGGKEIYCDNSVSGNMISDLGCGIIAAADSLLYQSIIKSAEDGTNVHLGNEEFNISSLSHIDYDEYIRYIILLSQEFYMHKWIFDGVIGTGAGKNLKNGMNQLANNMDLSIDCQWYCKENSYLCFKKEITEMINQGYPIPCSVCDPVGETQYLFTEQYTYNALDDKINSHYFNITELVEYSEDVKEYVGHQTIAQISTWGKRRYIDLYTYYTGSWLASGVVHIKEK